MNLEEHIEGNKKTEDRSIKEKFVSVFFNDYYSLIKQTKKDYILAILNQFYYYFVYFFFFVGFSVVFGFKMVLIYLIICLSFMLITVFSPKLYKNVMNNMSKYKSINK